LDYVVLLVAKCLSGFTHFVISISFYMKDDKSGGYGGPMGGGGGMGGMGGMGGGY
jgi:hypothetical protein